MEANASLIKDQVKSLFEEGYFCSEITTIILQDILGVKRNEVIRSMSAFSGGVGRNGTSCGALNGSLAVVGQLFGRGREGNADPQLPGYIEKVYEGFKHVTKDYKSIDCRDIVKVDWWNPDEALSYFKDAKKINRCHQLIVDTIMSTASILGEALRRDRSIANNQE
jgi:C_GCAxxG_C_C family probable redox protein